MQPRALHPTLVDHLFSKESLGTSLSGAFDTCGSMQASISKGNVYFTLHNIKKEEHGTNMIS